MNKAQLLDYIEAIGGTVSFAGVADVVLVGLASDRDSQTVARGATLEEAAAQLLDKLRGQRRRIGSRLRVALVSQRTQLQLELIKQRGDEGHPAVTLARRTIERTARQIELIDPPEPGEEL